jgi:hypothetical protein
MYEGEIAVGFEAPTEPSRRIGFGIEQQLRVAGDHHPLVSEDIARGDAKRLEDMGLGFLGATERVLCETDESVRGGQIAIQR